MIQFLFALIDIRLLCMTDGCPVPPYIFSGRLHRFLLHHGAVAAKEVRALAQLPGYLHKSGKSYFYKL